MPKTILEKQTCGKCGVDVREKTTFCYNCGSRVVDLAMPALPAESNGSVAGTRSERAVDDLAQRFRIEESEAPDKLAKAAAERRKARVSHRKSKEFVWVPEDSLSSRLIVLLAILVAALAAGVVFLALW